MALALKSRHSRDIKMTLTPLVSRRTGKALHDIAAERIEDAVELGPSFTQRTKATAVNL